MDNDENAERESLIGLNVEHLGTQQGFDRDKEIQASHNPMFRFAQKQSMYKGL